MESSRQSPGGFGTIGFAEAEVEGLVEGVDLDIESLLSGLASWESGATFGPLAAERTE